MSSNPELEQETAVDAAGNGFPQEGFDPSIVQSRPLLHSLSIEHAAFACSLSQPEIELAVLVGRGWSDAQIALELDVPISTVHGRMQMLRRKLGSKEQPVSRIELAVFGYRLRGGVDPELFKQKAA